MAETKRMTAEEVVGYLLEGEGLDFLRESLTWVCQQLMEVEVSELVGAARGERAPERPEVLIRAVQGVDPVRRGLLVSDEVKPGMRLAFAVRDAKAAREDLQNAVRDLLREAHKSYRALQQSAGQKFVFDV